jgi:hypothetical protein
MIWLWPSKALGQERVQVIFTGCKAMSLAKINNYANNYMLMGTDNHADAVSTQTRACENVISIESQQFGRNTGGRLHIAALHAPRCYSRSIQSTPLSEAPFVLEPRIMVIRSYS